MRQPKGGGERLNNKMMGQLLGGLLVVIAVILAAVQHFSIYNIYGSIDYKWYFYGLVAVIAIVGVLIVAWSYMMKKK
jgi:surface polysaccharide O-acyltransferase-like enzyme